ncbi:hypothetical protein FA780_06705 [Escherichia coli]|nr:hypothetical protein [Escherichia coli]EFC2182422.1 hypothetical protein [Escherichia coli]EFH8672032.1 hypothetical protein [Escherichia coli]EFH8717559.1 hypothetical protein [Escherichia coli]EFN4364549.1 hypothetical protein [Escherichia coli]
MSYGVSGCDVVVASGKKRQGVTTLPILFKTEKITSRCNCAEHYAPAQSPRQPCHPAAPPESR